MFNEWLDMFGLESTWNDPEWPTLSECMKKIEEEKVEPVFDNAGLYLYNKLKGQNHGQGTTSI